MSFRQSKSPLKTHPRIFGCLGILLILLVELGLTIFFILNRYVPQYLDGFQFFHVQYYFLNQEIINGEPAYWIPYLTHGTVSTWWYTIIAHVPYHVISFLSSFIPSLLGKLNYIPIFHTAIFIDEMILLVGTWLLSKRLYRTHLARFFVCASMFGSCIWFSQIWYNFHSYYLLPLIFYFFHRFLETHRWRYLTVIMGLTAFQNLGHLPYLLPLSTFSIFFYFTIGIFTHMNLSRSFIRNFRLSWKPIASLMTGLLFFVLIYLMMKVNTENIISFNFAREQDMTTSLKHFLTYGRNTGPWKWQELFTGVSPFVDMTLFSGFLTFPFIGLAAMSIRRRKSRLLGLFTLGLYLFSSAGFLATLLYYVWPFMKYYRHLSLIAPIIKFALLLWAGTGLDYGCILHRLKRHDLLKKYFLFCGIIFFILFGVCWSIYKSESSGKDFIEYIVEGSIIETDFDTKSRQYISGLPHILATLDVSQNFKISAFTLLVFAVLFCVLFVAKNRTLRYGVICVILALHFFHLFHYKFIQGQARFISWEEKYTEFAEFSDFDYSIRRREKLSLMKPRDELLLLYKDHVNYWSINMFLYLDEIAHSFRVDHWLRPFDDYLRTYEGQEDITDKSKRPKGSTPYHQMVFPLDHPASGKIAGLTEEKIQFFKKAYRLPDEKMIPKIMNNPKFTGDMILLSTNDPDVTLWDGKEINQQQRLHLRYGVSHFDANTITIQAHNPEPAPIWLHYSDTWDPHWRSFVNNQERPIYKSNLAYKAVKIDPGDNTIVFRYQHMNFLLLSLFWKAVGLFMFILLCVYFYREFLRMAFDSFKTLGGMLKNLHSAWSGFISKNGVKDRLIALALILFSYAMSLRRPFMLDDFDHFFHNQSLLHTSFLNLWTNGFRGFFRPFSYTFLKLIHELALQTSWIYHVSNLILFTCIVMLFYRWVVLLTSNRRLASWTIWLFAAHPVNGFFINYKTASALLIYILCTQLMCITWTKYLKSSSMKDFILSVFFCFTSIFSHEMGVLNPVYLLLISIIPFRQTIFTGIKLLPHLFVVVLFFILRSFPEGPRDLHLFSGGLSIVDYLSTTFVLISWYVSRLFIPWNILFIWDERISSNIIIAIIGVMLVLIAIIFSFILYQKHKNLRMISFATLLFLIGLSPILSAAFTYTQSTNTAMIEPHWFGFSSIGFFILFAYVCSIIESDWKKEWGYYLLRYSVVILVILNLIQLPVWRSERAFLKNWLSVNALNSSPWIYLSRNYIRYTLTDKNKLTPCNKLSNLGKAMQIDNNAEAVKIYQSVLKMDDTCTLGYYWLALLLHKANQEKPLNQVLTKVRSLDPGYFPIYEKYLNVVYNQQNKNDYREMKKLWTDYKKSKSGPTRPFDYIFD